jgi:hypothetical protein
MVCIALQPHIGHMLAVRFYFCHSCSHLQVLEVPVDLVDLVLSSDPTTCVSLL